MYLIALNNIDYILITLFFASLALSAYFYRRKTVTSNDFLFTQTKFDQSLFYLGGFGLIEVILASVVSSKIGISAFYLMLLVLFISIFVFPHILEKKYNACGANSLNDYACSQMSQKTATMIAILSIVFLSALALITELIAYKLLHSLFGWNFNNSVIGVMALILITLIIGGNAFLKSSTNFNLILILGILIVTIGYAFFALNGISGINAKLTNLAIANAYNKDFYTVLHLKREFLNSMFLLLLGYGSYYFLVHYVKNIAENTTSNGLAFISKVIILLIIILPGILAISTKMPTTNIAGKEIVTTEALMPDGQTGYIVKAIDSNSIKKDTAPGLIPPNLNFETSATHTNGYNYDLANVVMLKHYIPNYLRFILVIFVLALFIISFSSYILHAARIFLRNIVIPNNLFSKYGEEKNLWIIRFSILFLSVTTTIIAEKCFLNDFMFIKALAVSVAIFAAPIVAIVIVRLIAYEQNGYIAIILGVVSAVLLSYFYPDNDYLHKYALIALVNFVLTGVSALILKNFRRIIN